MTKYGIGRLPKHEHFRYLLRELAMIRYDLAVLTGDTRDALVRQIDELTCGVETRAEYEQEKDERIAAEHGEQREN